VKRSDYCRLAWGNHFFTFFLLKTHRVPKVWQNSLDTLITLRRKTRTDKTLGLLFQQGTSIIVKRRTLERVSGFQISVIVKMQILSLFLSLNRRKTRNYEIIPALFTRFARCTLAIARYMGGTHER